MKVIEIIQRIQSLYSKGVQSDDSRLSSRHIYNKLITVRARLVSQEAKKKQKTSRWNYQAIECIELIEVPEHNCPCIPVPGCIILRSKYKLPKPLQGLDSNLIESVTTIDRQTKINELNLSSFKYQRGNKYTKASLSYFIDNEYLYITTPTTIRIVRLVGLFDDPIKAKEFEGYCKSDCKDCGKDCIDYTEVEFPIDADMIDTLIELSIKELIEIFSKGVQDTNNNSSEDR